MPPYVKKFATKAERADAMRKQFNELRAKYPEKFDAKKIGQINSAKAAERKKLAKKSTAGKQSVPQRSDAGSAPVAPAPVTPPPEKKIEPAAQPHASTASPSPSISGNSSPAIPDTKIFPESVPPPKIETAGPSQSGPEIKPGENPPPLNTPPPAPEKELPPPDLRGLATTVWFGIVNLLAAIFGDFMYPRKVGSNAAAGEIPFDETEPVITAWANYFQSLGLKPLRPLVALWLAILGYMLPRASFIVAKIKAGFKKKTVAGDRGGPAPETAASKPAQEPTPAPGAPAKTPPAPATAPAPPGEVEPLADS
jgi:hypothetical protein